MLEAPHLQEEEVRTCCLRPACSVAIRHHFSVRAHVWLQADGLASFLTPLLALDPDLRPSAARALQHPWLNPTEAGAGEVE